MRARAYLRQGTIQFAMKYSLIALSFSLVFSCSSPKKTESNELQLPSWLEGDWVRTNDGQAKITYEQWTKTSDEEYAGLGFTVRMDSSISEPDTVFMEYMRILAINDTLTLEVVGVNETPTLFKFIDQTDTSFVCVNPKNDFPKKIAYTLKNDYIEAIISGPGQDISFVFKENN